MFNKVFFTFVFCIQVAFVFGQRFKYELYDKENTPFEKVNQVQQDNLEYIWLATDQGLFRFNGTTFVDFNLTLKSRYIKSIIPWSKDTLLFSNDTGIHKLFYDYGHPVISDFHQTSNGGMTYPEKLFKDSKGRLWVGQPDGSVYLFDNIAANGKKLVLTSSQNTPNIYVREDSYGTIWALIPNKGLFAYSESEQVFTKLDSASKIEHFFIEDNSIWLCGDAITALTVDENAQITGRTKVGTSGLVGDIDYITKDLSGNLWAVSNDQLFILNRQNSAAEWIKVFGSNDPHRVQDFPFKTINYLSFTPDQVHPGGLIWVSTSNGLGLMWSSYFQGVSEMPFDNVFAISSTSNGDVLISQGNVNRITFKKGQISYEPVPGLARVTGISAYRNLVYYSTADGFITQHNNSTALKTYDLTQRGGGVFYMYADHWGDNWFCQAPKDKPIMGVAKINPQGEIIEYGKEKGLDSRILVLKEGGKHELYAAGIGTESYLYKYDRSTDRFENKSLSFSFKVDSNFEVHDLTVDQNGIVWMGTTAGLLKYDTERVTRVPMGPFTKNEIRAVSAIKDGTLWLSTDTNGLIHIEHDGNYVLFDELSGTPSKVASYRCLTTDNKGRLWAGTVEGAVYSSQESPKPLSSIGPILRTIAVNNKILDTDIFEFSEKDIITFSLTCIAFPGDQVQYSYKTFKTGLTKEAIEEIAWSLPQESNEIIIQGLKGDNYKLLVKAQNSGGYGWSDVTNFGFTIKQPWYNTWWGISLLAIAAAFFFWFYLRLWIHKKIKGLELSLNQKQKELDDKEAELGSSTNVLKDQEDVLKSTKANIYLLYRLLRQIPEGSNWDKIMPVLSKLVELPTGIDAFELAYKTGQELAYKGFVREKTEPQFRTEEFSEKDNLASYAMVTNRPIIIGDLKSEVTKYVTKPDLLGYGSQMLIPFELNNKSQVVLCIYAIENNSFSQKDLTLIQILALFLATNVNEELK